MASRDGRGTKAVRRWKILKTRRRRKGRKMNYFLTKWARHSIMVMGLVDSQ